MQMQEETHGEEDEPTDAELREYVTAEVDACEDLMSITARGIRHDAQLRFGFDLRARSQLISDWALEAAHAKQARGGGAGAVLDEDDEDGAPAADGPEERGEEDGAPAADGLDEDGPNPNPNPNVLAVFVGGGGGADDARAGSASDSDAAPEEEDDEGLEGLRAAVLALTAFVRALPTVVLGAEGGEYEEAVSSLDRAARLCRHAGAQLARPEMAAEFARLERHARELQVSLRAYITKRAVVTSSRTMSRPAHGAARRARARAPKLQRAGARSVRTRAVGVATRQLLRELESEDAQSSIHDPATAAERSSDELVVQLYARMRRDFGGVLVHLEATGVTEARVKALISLELEQSMQPLLLL
jgi:hypothetical protein